MKEYSILDAFRALNDLEEEEVKQTKKASLKEGKDFDMRSADEMRAAKTFMEENKETEIKVIDVDADSLDHIKNNEEYIGQYILQCRACNTLRYINTDDLEESEETPDVYNMESECPHCHAVNSGYTLIGQVGAVEKVKPEGEEEISFEKEETIEEPAEEVPAEEPKMSEEEMEASYQDEPEASGDETAYADDTEDMEDHTGDVIDDEDVAEDDTEEPVEKESEEDNEIFDFEEAEKEEEKKKAKKESLEEDPEKRLSLKEFLCDCVEPENIEKLIVCNNEDEGKEIYKGSYKEIPNDIMNARVCEFDCDGNNWTMNVESNPEKVCAKSLLDKCVGDKVIIWDNDEGDEAYCGSIAEVPEEICNKACASFEVPSVIRVYVVGVKNHDALTEDFGGLGTSKEDTLIKHIFEINHLNYNNVEDIKCAEHWIVDDIKHDGDLGSVFASYVFPTGSASLLKEFESVTGYKVDLETKCKMMGIDPEASWDNAKEVVHPEEEKVEYVDKTEPVKVESEEPKKEEPEERVVVEPVKPIEESLKEDHHVCPDCGKEPCECHKVCPKCGKEVCECSSKVDEAVQLKDGSIQMSVFDYDEEGNIKPEVAKAIENGTVEKEPVEKKEPEKEPEVKAPEDDPNQTHLQFEEDKEEDKFKKDFAKMAAEVDSAFAESLEENLNERSFNRAINKFLGEGITFEATKAIKDDKNYMVEGTVKGEGAESVVQFMLETVSPKLFKVTNTLSEEMFNLKSIVLKGNRIFKLED